MDPSKGIKVPLTAESVKRGVLANAQYIQDLKTDYSKATIRTLQSQDKWPEEYLSYNGKPSRKNEYKNPQRFFTHMGKKPEWFNRNWYFRPYSDADEARMREALIYASNAAYPQVLYHKDDGNYERAMRVVARKGTDITVRKTVAELPPAPPGTRYEIVNLITYAARLETIALYYHHQQGILWHAYQKTKAKFPDLTVSFDFANASSYPGVAHNYMLPRLSIGRNQDLSPKAKRPGNRHRRRRRGARALQRARRGR